MSFSEKAQAAKAGAPAPSGVAPKTKEDAKGAVKAKAPGEGGTDAKQKASDFRSKGEAIRANMTDDQKNLEGTKSDTVEFLATLGNPCISQPRKAGADYVPSHRSCGYQVKLLEDMMIPVAPLKPECKDEYDVQLPQTERQGKAGEIVNLNIMEAAMLISRNEFAGRFTGNGKETFIVPTFRAGKDDPNPCLRMTGSTIKSNMILVAEEGKGEAGMKAKVLPGFEAFEPLFRVKASTRGGNGTPKKAGEATKNTAAAFRSLLNM